MMRKSSALLLLALALLAAQVARASAGSGITIDSPRSGTVTSAASITVSGRTSEPATVTISSPAGILTVKTDPLGNFSVLVTLLEGRNEIVVTAEDSAGNVSSPVSMTVIRTAPPLMTYVLVLTVIGLVLVAIGVLRK